MNITNLFTKYAEDFELTFLDDDWSRLEQYFTENAIYKTGGVFSSESRGRENILAVLRANISRFDRKCDSRRLETIDGPHVTGVILKRRWRCNFTLRGATDLSIIGDEHVHYEGTRICKLEESLTNDSQLLLSDWIKKHKSTMER